MELRFQISQEDYKKFFYYLYFRRNLLLRIGSVALLSYVIGNSREPGSPSPITDFLILFSIAALLLFFLMFLLPYLFSLRKIKRAAKNKKSLNRSIMIKTSESGMEVELDSETVFYNWDLLRKAELGKDFAWILLYSRKLYLIPIVAFRDSAEAKAFIAMFKQQIEISRKRGNSYREVRRFYILGIAGILPNFGLITGSIVFVKGFKYKNLGLKLIGLGGVLFTFVFWVVIFPFIKPELSTSFAQHQLNDLFKEVELYKVQFGAYPDSLPQLLEVNKRINIKDPLQTKDKQNTPYFRYENLGDRYMLFSCGKDGIPHTADDLYPVFSGNTKSSVGWVKSKE